jgi:hypothetical protein
VKSYLINKHDFFRPRAQEHAPSFQDLPETICICSDCLFQDAIEASFIYRRTIESGREITQTDELPEQDRPRRCHLCGRHLTYSGHAATAAAGIHQPAPDRAAL